MGFNYNGEGVEPRIGSGGPIPKGYYILRIADTEETKSKTSGNDQVVVHFKVNEGPYAGRQVRYHRVTFFAPDDPNAGWALGFLKAIGCPHEGKFVVNHAQWRGRLIGANVDEEEYNGRVNNKINGIEAVGDPLAFLKAHPEMEEVPF